MPTNKSEREKFKAEVERLIVAGIRLAIVRHNLKDEEGVDISDEEAEHIGQDAAWACQGEGTCDETPIEEWTKVQGWQAARAVDTDLRLKHAKLVRAVGEAECSPECDEVCHAENCQNAVTANRLVALQEENDQLKAHAESVAPQTVIRCETCQEAFLYKRTAEGYSILAHKHHKAESLSGAAPTELRELLCQKCGRDYPVWFAPNELWNRVAKDDEHFLCMDCFALLAESRGIAPTAWMLLEEKLDISSVLEELRRYKLAGCATP